MAGERLLRFLTGRGLTVFSDGPAKDSIGFRSSCTGRALSRIADTIYSTPLSLKKKELFHVKEAHNHSFSHAVRIYLCFSPAPLMIFRRQIGDGITIGRYCGDQ